jgi:hypothetical protein
LAFPMLTASGIIPAAIMVSIASKALGPPGLRCGKPPGLLRGVGRGATLYDRGIATRLIARP